MAISSGTSQPLKVTSEHVLGQIAAALETKGNHKNNHGRCNPEDWDRGVAGNMSNKNAGIKPVHTVTSPERKKEEEAFLYQVLKHCDTIGLTKEGLKILEKKKIDVIVQPADAKEFPHIKAWLLGVIAKDNNVTLNDATTLLAHQVTTPIPTLNEYSKRELIIIKVTEKELKHCQPVSGLQFEKGGRHMNNMTVNQFLEMTGEEAGKDCCLCCKPKRIHVADVAEFKLSENDLLTGNTDCDSGGSNTAAPFLGMRGPNMDIIIP